MASYPVRLRRDPIVEAVFEIRFQASVPDEAVYGIVFRALRKDFDSENALEITRVPKEIRDKDPNQRYAAWHRFERLPYRLDLGPRSMVFANLKPYAGWVAWSGFFQGLLSKIAEIDIIGTVERMGLRYINFFDAPIFPDANVDLSIAGSRVATESTTIRTEIADRDFTKILLLGNNVNLSVQGEMRTGSVIDIDCLRNVGESGDAFLNEYMPILEIAHNMEKELFFELIRGSIQDAHDPIFAEE